MSAYELGSLLYYGAGAVGVCLAFGVLVMGLYDHVIVKARKWGGK